MDEIRGLVHVGETRTAAQFNAIAGFFAAGRDINLYPAVHSRMHAKPGCESGGRVHDFIPRPYANSQYERAPFWPTAATNRQNKAERQMWCLIHIVKFAK